MRLGKPYISVEWWEIENVLTISIDNASSNDATIGYLKERKKKSNWKHCVLKGEYLHILCVGLILNLVVQLCKIVSTMFDLWVKWVKNSPSRIDLFKKSVESENCCSNIYDVTSEISRTLMWIHILSLIIPISMVSLE